MNFSTAHTEIPLLQKILEAKLLRVFCYSRYSLLVSGQERLSHYCFFTDKATQNLDQSREIMRALVLLGESYDISAPYPELDPQFKSMASLLRQAIADETHLLSLCQQLSNNIAKKDTYFWQLARSLRVETHQSIATMVNLLNQLETKAEPKSRTETAPLSMKSVHCSPYATQRSA